MRTRRTSGVYCSATSTRYRGGCTDIAWFLVGIPGAEHDQWRASCTQHLGKVVRERIHALSATGSVVVAELSERTADKEK